MPGRARLLKITGQTTTKFYKRGLNPVFFAMKDLSLLMLYRQHETTQ